MHGPYDIIFFMSRPSMSHKKVSPSQSAPNKSTHWHVWSPPLLAVILLFTAFALKWPLASAMVMATLYTCVIGIVRGYAPRQLWAFMRTGMAATVPVLVILTLVGALIGVWAGTGTITTMIAIGLKVVQPQWFLLSCFIATGAVSMLIGSAVGTLSTIGLAMIGMASSLGLPVGWVGGALLSGALLGDRSAFVSSTYHLAMSSAGASPERSWSLVLRRAAPAIAVSIALYAVVGWHLSQDNASIPVATLTMDNEISWMLMLAPGVVLAMAIAKISARLALAAGLAVAAGVGFSAGIAPQTILGWMWSGANVVSPAGELLHSGGIVNMLAIFLIILAAAAFNGVYEGTGLLDVIVRPLVARAHSPAGLLRRASAASIVVAAVACNQTLSLIMPGRMFRGALERRSLTPAVLAVTLLDAGGLAAGLIPWNQFAIVCAAVIGMLPQHIAFYAVLPWVLLISSIIQPAATRPDIKPEAVSPTVN